MKCLHCHAYFEPTEQELEWLRHSNCSTIPFCSKKCFDIAGPNVGPKTHKHLFWHEGPRTEQKYGGGNHISVKPMTDSDYHSIEKWRGRGGFSEGATVLLLPSSVFYGKLNNPIYWK